MGSINYENSKDEYQQLFDKCAIQSGKTGSLDEIIDRLERNMAPYQTLEKRLGIPWYFIAVIHERESSGHFDRHLHNGDPLTAPTVHRPAGRPPYGGPTFTWEDSAEDALRYKDLDEWTDWSVPGMLYQLEGYNGFGYRLHHPETLSPYLWSFSTNYQKGKYDRDGHFNPDLVDEQAGTATLLRRMVDLKKDYVQDLAAAPAPKPPAAPKPVKPETFIYTVKPGDNLTKIAKQLGLSSWRDLWKANLDTIQDPNLIQIGQKLVIPTAQPTEPPEAPPPVETSDFIIREGDSLTRIAKVFGITMGDLLRMNPQLCKQGDIIKVPRRTQEDPNIPASLVPGQDRLWMEIAARELGVAEYSNGDNPRILEYIRTTSTGEPECDEVKWCAAFVNWCILHAGLKARGSAAAKDWLNWGIKLDAPRHGCVVVFRFTEGYHVGFLEKIIDDDYLKVLGGNQSDQVRYSNYLRSSAVGYRWPDEIPL